MPNAQSSGEVDAIFPLAKSMGKAKMTADVAVMDVSQPSLGVRTRAKTLALRRLQSAPDTCYLELRSRRLEEHMQQLKHNSKIIAVEKEEDMEAHVSSSIHGAFGDNNFEINQAREKRCTRESTPCSLIKDADTITIPGSTNRIVQNTLQMNVPSAFELDEFFRHEEQSMQRHFIDKYNFDVVNDVPLPGRYEWASETLSRNECIGEEQMHGK